MKSRKARSALCEVYGYACGQVNALDGMEVDTQFVHIPLLRSGMHLAYHEMIGKGFVVQQFQFGLLLAELLQHLLPLRLPR